MKKFILSLVLMSCAAGMAAQDTLWVRYDDRFKANGSLSLKDVDSIEINNTELKLYTTKNSAGYLRKAYASFIPTDAAEVSFFDPGRYLLKPDTYAGTDYTNANATEGYNFAHCLESDHYAVFWDVRYGENPAKLQYPGDGNVANANTILSICERCWDTYVKLGFIVPGKSLTDKYKIQLYVPYQKEWRADASGTNGVSGGMTGIGHFNPWAAIARGGHTVAHEVGHTFQFLTGADQGGGYNYGFNYGFDENSSGDSFFWESCADWQAYKIFPERQFTDGEYFEQHIGKHHLNFMSEDWLYANCFIQDWWCMKHGTDFIGRLWRESRRPEDPIEAYQRLCGLSQADFCDEQMEGYMRMATWDIDGVREAARHRIGQHVGANYLNKVSGTADTWQTDVEHCIQNYGYHIVNLKNVTNAGTVVKAHFTGFPEKDGYKSVYPERAGWRYALVALTSDGARVYGDIQREKEGVATLTVPQNCQRLFFVVMGAPTVHWHHPWARWHSEPYPQNGEQWPYQVRFEGTDVQK